MTESKITDVLSQEQLEDHARDGDVIACFELINQRIDSDGDDWAEWSVRVETILGEADPWEAAEDLAAAFEKFDGALPSEWLDDARACHWLMSRDGIQALETLRRDLQVEPSVSNEGVWSIPRNDELIQAIELSGYWVALSKIAPTSPGHGAAATRASSLVDDAVECGVKLIEPWPLVAERVGTADLVAVGLFFDHMRSSWESPYEDGFHSDVLDDPYSIWASLTFASGLVIAEARMQAIAASFEANGEILTALYGHGPEACHLLMGEGSRGAINIAMYQDTEPMIELLDQGCWFAFATCEAENFAFSDGSPLLGADLGPFESEIDSYFEFLLTVGYDPW